MEQRLLHLVLFSGFLSVILCESRNLTEFVLIREYKTWNEAQEFCRQNYIDLVTVQTDEEWNELNKLRANYLSYTWIGLYDDVNSWRWSFRDERPTYTRWDEDQPDNYGGDQHCVMLHANGYWRDKGCNLKCTVSCQSGQGPVLVIDTMMSWKQAQSFCRENFIDLYTVKNESENQLLRMMTSNDGSCIWIGLFRDKWKWSDQTNTSASLRWAQKQPDNYFGSEICAAVDEDGWIVDEQCSNKFFFVCKNPLPVKRQILRLEVKAGDNVSDQFADAVLKEVQQKLQKQGMAADVKLSWREQPNGSVFQTLNKDHYRLTKGDDD